MKQPTLLRPLLGGALLLLLAVPVMAQPERGPRDGSDGPPRGPRDGMRRGPERGPRASMELNRIWHDIADLEAGKLALTKAQSAQIVALVLPVSKRQSLGDDDAQTLADKIEAVLTSAQKAEIEDNRPRGGRGGPRGGNGPRRGGGGPRGGAERGPRPDGPPRDGEQRGPRRGGGRDGGPRGGGRPDGPPRMNREDFEKVRPFMDALNPFYPPTGYAGFKALPDEFAKDVAKRYGERRELLETLSNRAKSQ